MNRQTDPLQRALALHKSGDSAGAEKIYRRVLKSDPGNGSVRYLLGVACLEQGKFAKGRTALEQALRRDPQNPDILFSLGRALQSLGDRDAALNRLEAARDLAPHRADIWAATGDVLLQQDRSHEAIAAYAQALELNPDDWRVFANAAFVHIGVGNLDEGAVMLRRLATNQQHPKILLNLALTEQALGNYAAAAQTFEELSVLDPDNVEARAGRAMHLQTIGQGDKAWGFLQRLDKEAFRKSLPALAFAGIAPAHDDKEQSLTRQARGYIEDALEVPTVTTHDQALLNFALGHLNDRLGAFDAAFDAFSTGNALSPASYDPEELEKRFRHLREFFTAERFAELSRSNVYCDRPVFIVGVPRSGTSLVEQILDSHPDAAGAGELVEIQSMERELGVGEEPQRLVGAAAEDLNPYTERYLHLLDRTDASAVRVTDKLPGNFARLGLIALLFPGARVLHCVRDPLDTCLSCYFQDFRFRNSYSFSLEHLGHYYAQYVAMMDHWRAVLPIPILDVGYEELVADPRGVTAEMLEFCGLEWDERCLAFHENPRVVATASADQVRQPLYSKSVGRSAHYRHRLEPLIQALQAQGVAIAEL